MNHFSSSLSPFKQDYVQDYVFRVLHPDETGSYVHPKIPKLDSKSYDQAIKEHVIYGSNPNYTGCAISFTSELFVALVWAGCLSEIGFTTLSNHKDNDYRRLDKLYLCPAEIRKHSTRSDEVLFFFC